jgi:hypothetical protein
MLEAVNSTLQNAAILKPIAAQNSSTESLAANPQRVQRSASAPFVSPFIFVDSANEQVVLQIRNNETGDALNQFPSQAYARPEGTPEQTAPSVVALEAQAAIETQTAAAAAQSAPPPAQQAPTQQQSAAFASASVSGSPLQSAGVSVFA